MSLTPQQIYEAATLLKNDMNFVLEVKEDVLAANSGTGILSQLSKAMSVTPATKTELNGELQTAIVSILDAKYAALSSDFDQLFPVTIP